MINGFSVIVFIPQFLFSKLNFVTVAVNTIDAINVIIFASARFVDYTLFISINEH